MHTKELSDEVFTKRECEKCQYTWLPRSENPKRCPRCQAWLWPDESEEETHEGELIEST